MVTNMAIERTPSTTPPKTNEIFLRRMNESERGEDVRVSGEGGESVEGRKSPVRTRSSSLERNIDRAVGIDVDEDTDGDGTID